MTANMVRRIISRRVELAMDYDGKAMEVSFNQRFVTDMLRVLNADDSLTLELVDDGSAALFCHGDDSSYDSGMTTWE